MTLNASNQSTVLFRRGPALIIWTLTILAYLAFFVLELQLDFNQLLEPCEGTACNWAAITENEVAALENRGLTTRFYAGLYTGGIVFTVAFFALLGGLIFWRLGTTPIGFTVSLALIIMPIASFADADNVVAHYPGLALPIITLSVIGTCFNFVLVYLFPNGRFYPRWSPIVLVASMIYVNISLLTYGGFASSPALAAIGNDFVYYFLFIAAALVFQVMRYFRNATPIERLQTRWVIFGFVFYFLGPVLWFVLYGGIVEYTPGAARLLIMSGGWILLQIIQLVFPMTIAAAILRYRLWNIDLIIRRTLIYASLTGMLALLYFGFVVMLQAVFGGLAGDTEAPLVTVLSTLAIAALFNPLRGRMQSLIDRRFYRHKYNAELAVERFAAHARDEVDLNRLAGAVLETVDETMQPYSANLWLKE